MINLTKFAENLKDLIFDNNLTQTKLAENTGIDKAAICRYLKGNCMPNLNSVIVLADYFNCSIDFLMGCSEEKSKTEFLPCPPFSERLNYYLKNYDGTGYSLCKTIGLPDNRFYHWLNGTHFPSIENVEKLSIFFKCSIDSFLGREN